MPAVHLADGADGAYISAALLVRSARDHGVTLRGPTKPGGAWQARDGGFTPDAFHVDGRQSTGGTSR